MKYAYASFSLFTPFLLNPRLLHTADLRQAHRRLLALSSVLNCPWIHVQLTIGFNFLCSPPASPTYNSRGSGVTTTNT
jgi:hypothetical protein